MNLLFKNYLFCLIEYTLYVTVTFFKRKLLNSQNICCFGFVQLTHISLRSLF